MSSGAFEFLRQAVRASVARDAGAPVNVSGAGPENWSSVLWLGRRHGALLHVLAAVEDAPDHAPPPEVLAGLVQHRYSEAVARLARVREMVAIHRAVHAEGIPIVAAGHWALSQSCYRQPQLRTVGQRDRFLVRPGDRARAEACLVPLGYEFGPHDPLELQTHHRTKVVLVESAVAWRSRSVTVGPLQIRVPEPGDWLQMIGDRFGRRTRAKTLEHAFDIVSLLRSGGEIDWDAVIGGPHGSRQRTVAAVAASCDLLEAPRPGAIEAWCRRSARLRRAVQLLVESFSTGPTAVRRRSARMRAAALARDARESMGRFAPTPASVADRMLAAAGVGPGDVVYDLGCGDGRIVIQAALAYGARAVGVDSDPERLREACEAAEHAGVTDRVSFVRGDILATDIAPASVVCLYLQGFAYNSLRPWLCSTLRPGSRIVSHHLSFPGWEPSRTEIVAGEAGRASFVYVWVVP